MSSSNKGTKMSLGEFQGPSATGGGGGRPTGPRARGPDDDGSFQRYPKRGEQREHTRSEQDSSWRRGGGAEDNSRASRGGNGEGGFRSSERNSYNNNHNNERGEERGGGSWRGGGNDRQRDDRGSDRLMRDDRGRSNWRGGGGGDAASRGADTGSSVAPTTSGGERPRFQLKQKGGGAPSRDGDNVTAQIEQLEVHDNNDDINTSTEKADVSPDTNAPATTSRPKREPDVVNSRAAGLSGGDSSYRRENRERGPASGRGGGNNDDVRRDDRGPPPVANSRFVAAAEADRSNRDEFRRDERGPPPVANSRFAAAAESDRSNRDDFRRDERGPPPVANSRFAAAAESDRSSRDEFRRDERGPPPVANSRFAAAAESDRSNRDEFRRDERGPPPVANSRFAAAAAMAEQESGEREQRRMEYSDDRKGGGSRFDRGGPPLAQSSRFAAAAMADSDYVDREERDRRHVERQNDRQEGGPREDRRFGGARVDRGYGGSRYDRGAAPEQEKDYFEMRKEKNNKVAELLKPKAPPAEDNILKIPDKSAPQHEENMLKMPTKETKKETASPPKQKAKEPEAPRAPAAIHSEESLQEFISGNKQGDDLKAWCEAQGAALPPVKRLVFSLLSEKEKLNPDINCSWAEPSKFGAALLSMVDEDLFGQMQILWGIQQYCDSLGFPKLNEEYIVQAMFRSMYKYDLASDDAFLAWKEDESEEHEKGKMTAIIQTVDWFNWLEEDEQEDEDEEDYEEE